jgi:hypothetical protein
MARPQPIRTRPGRRQGEWVITLPPAWELRLRRVLRALHADSLPDPRESGLTPAQREVRLRARRKYMHRAMGQFVSDLMIADIVGKEVALATRGRFGQRRGSLREHVYALIREA